MTKIVRPDGSAADASPERLAEIRENFHSDYITFTTTNASIAVDLMQSEIVNMSTIVADLLAMIDERDAALAVATATTCMEADAFDDLVRRVLTELPERKPDVPPKLRLSLASRAIEDSRTRLAAAEARLAKLDSDPWFEAMNAVLAAVKSWKTWNATESRWSTSELHLSDCFDRLLDVEKSAEYRASVEEPPATDATVERCRRCGLEWTCPDCDDGPEDACVACEIGATGDGALDPGHSGTPACEHYKEKR